MKARLRAAREAAGHSQASLAEAVGVDRKTIGNLESGKPDVGLGSGVTLWAVLGELGLLSGAPAARAGAAPAPAQPTPDDRLRALEGAVGAMAAKLEELVVELRADRAAARQPAEGTARPQRAGSA